MKRALREVWHVVVGGAVLLLLLAGMILAGSHMLYADQISGRIAIGAVLPENDGLARQMVRMLGSLDTVESLCDFRILDRNQAEQELEDGKLFAVIVIPEQMVQGIMDGTNPPVQVILPRAVSVESRIFRELTEAGAGILASAQAGIYAGDSLCVQLGMKEAVPVLEKELNQLYLSYSLSRGSCFTEKRISAAGDVEPLLFYCISGFVFYLLLCAIPVSGYLAPLPRVMEQKLRILGVKPGMRILAELLGISALLLLASLPWMAGAVLFEMKLWSWQAILTLILVVAGVGSGARLFCQMAGSAGGGVMALFLSGTFLHFLSGGFLPLVFLPEVIQKAAAFLPNRIWMEGVQMIATDHYSLEIWGALGGVVLFFCAVTAGVRTR